jgi:hypothetical protein
MLAGTMGNAGAAAAHFETALQTNARLGARPALARTQYAYAQLLIGRQRADRPGPSATERERAAQLLREAYASALELGMQSLLSRVAALAARAGLQIDAQPQTVAADLPEAPLPSRLVCRFRREGEYWALGCGDRIFRLQHLRGLTYIDQLLRRPGVDVHVFDLIDLADGMTMDRRGVQRRDEGDTGPLLDATARAALKTRLQELREELAEAEDANDLGRAERHREEIDQLAEHLAAATGLGGRDRGAGAQANRARVAVAKAIRVSLARIAEQSSDLAQHLDRAIKTGMFCCYVPDPLRPVAWELD